jgi:hypothetical protein
MSVLRRPFGTALCTTLRTVLSTIITSYVTTRAFPEMIDSGDSNFLANQIQASCWKEASMDAETLF